MGTPDFAAGILTQILNAEYEVAGVVTVADKPAGRGQKLHESAVKLLAQEKGLPILQPTNLKDETFLQELKNLNANLFVIVAFRMLPKQVWQMPELGTFNLHASLLPQYRGAAPINWTIINGETETGVSTFFIDDKIDTGEIILQDKTPISDNENAGSLHDRLMEMGGQTVIKTLELIANQQVQTVQQPENADLKTAYKLNKENCKINWQQNAKTIHNQIRGLSPYPAAWCFIKDQELEWNVKIYESEIITENHTLPAGTIITDKNSLKVAVNDGFINIKNIQFPGKKRMPAKDLLNGVQFSENALAY